MNLNALFALSQLVGRHMLERGYALHELESMRTGWPKHLARGTGLVSIVLDGDRYSEAQVNAFVDALKLFKIGYSWGGPMSLVMPYGLRGMRQFGPLAGAKNGTLVRFALGLEDVQDLITDLDQAFAALNA